MKQHREVPPPFPPSILADQLLFLQEAFGVCKRRWVQLKGLL